MIKTANSLLKFSLLLILFALAIKYVLPMLYMKTYKVINQVDNTIYARYATDGKYDENIFFNVKVEEETGFISEISNKIDDVSKIKRIQEFAKVVSENSDEIIELVENNTEYKSYLKDRGSSVQELILWSEKTASLDDNICVMWIYVICLVFAFLTVVVFKLRRLFYFLAGIIYFLVMTSVFSVGLSDYLVANLLNVIAQSSSDSFTYQDMYAFKKLFIQAFKESMLTFIIFDTIIQITQGSRASKRKDNILEAIYSIDFQINYLRDYASYECLYIAKLNIPSKEIMKICRRESKHYSKTLKKTRISIQYIQSIKRKKDSYDRLLLMMHEITNFGTEHTTSEYIAIFKEVRELIYELVYVINKM